MASPRLPRFRRVSTLSPIVLTERDEKILRLVHEHRFLRSSHVMALLEGSAQQIIRRLQLLYHHGYLERPRIQIEYFGKGGSKAIVYGLGNKGAKFLKSLGVRLRHVRWNEKNQSVRRIFLEHALAVSDFMVALELSAQKTPSVTYVPEALIRVRRKRGGRNQFRWRVVLPGGVRLGIVPDRVFALEKTNVTPDPRPAFFFVEADRGTMPVIRKNLLRTSMHRKLLTYEATWKAGLHKSLFGFHRFRVLIVTTSSARTSSLTEACMKLKTGRGLFLFCDRATLAKHENIFDAPWKTAEDGTTTLLP